MLKFKNKVKAKNYEWKRRMEVAERNQNRDAILRGLAFDKAAKVEEVKLRGKIAENETWGLSLQEIRYLDQHFAQKSHKKVSRVVDKMFAGIRYFSKFNRKIWSVILVDSEISIILLGKHQTLFKEGDMSTHMYVILRGAVEVRTFNRRTNRQMTVATLADGDHFGDNSFLQSVTKESEETDEQKKQHKRVADIFAIEDTHLVEIPRKIVEETFRLSKANYDVDQRVDFLANLSVFQGVPRSFIVPLAGNIDQRKYGLGEFILWAGQEPEGLYILKSGECLAVLEKQEKREF
jgi:CRP-like cAMP-binding protein